LAWRVEIVDATIEHCHAIRRRRNAKPPLVACGQIFALIAEKKHGGNRSVLRFLSLRVSREGGARGRNAQVSARAVRTRVEGRDTEDIRIFLDCAEDTEDTRRSGAIYAL